MLDTRRATEDEAPSPILRIPRTTHEAELARLTRQYAPFAGSPRNALNLLVGLRTGSTITLQQDDGREFSFTPPATPFGWSHIQRILNLARSGLASFDIDRPKPIHIAIALMGGTLLFSNASVELPGIVRLHRAGVPWTRIAHTFVRAANTSAPTKLQMRAVAAVDIP